VAVPPRRIVLVLVALLGFSLLAVSVVLMSRDADETSAPSYVNMVIPLQETFSKYGATVAFSRDEGAPTYEIVINMPDFIKAIPSMQRKNILSPNLTPGYIDRHPITLVKAGALSISAGSLFIIYKYGGETRTINFATFLMDLDDYGHLQKREMFSFSLTKELFDKIEWKDFRVSTLPKLAPNYRESPWLTDIVTSELK
jgi:hypothetical protein